MPQTFTYPFTKRLAFFCAFVFFSATGAFAAGTAPAINSFSPAKAAADASVLPSISSLTAIGGTTTNAATIQYAAIFNAPVTGLSASNFSLNTFGGVSGASVIDVSGSGNNWTITVNTGSGEGTIQLVMNNATGLSSGLSNLPFAGDTFSIDKTAPTVSISPPSVSYANNSTSVTYTVTYSDANFGSISLAPIQVFFNLTTTGTASLNSLIVYPPTGNTTQVTFNMSGDGTVAFTVPAGTGTDLAGNSNAASSLSPSFTVDNTAPTVSIGAPSTTVTSAGPVSYTVSYADANFNTSTLSPADISANATKTGTADFSSVTVTGSGTTYTVTFLGTSGTGTLGFTVPAGTATDQAGNAASASSPSATFNVDNTAPTVTVSAPSISNANSSGVIDFTVTYNDANFDPASIHLTAGDVSLNTTSSASVSSVVVTGSGNTRTVELAGVAGNGTVGITIPAGTAADLAGIQALASSPSALVTIDNTPPTLTSGSYYSNNGISTQYAKAGDVINLTVGYNEALQSDVMTIGGNPTITTGSNGNKNWAAAYIVQGTDPDGPMAFDIQATDLAGNTADDFSAKYGAYVIIDNTPPAITIDPPSASATSTMPVTYNVTYSDATFNYSSLSLSDITLNTTGTANGTVGLSGSGTSYTVTISDITGQGTLGISIGANTAYDIPGNAALASGPSSTFNVIAANNAVVTTLQVGNSILSPTFSSSKNTYTANMTKGATGVTVYMTTENPEATITVNGNPVTPGVRTSTIPMNVGANTLNIVVSAPDGVTTKTYTVTVNRPPSNNASFTSIALSPTTALAGTTGPATLNFTATVPYSVSSIQVVPTAADAGATIAVNGVAVTSGAASQAITLPVGQTIITTVITSQDGSVTKNAIITVTRGLSAIASLSNLTADVTTLSPAFVSTTLNYAATVPYTTASVTLTPTTTDAGATVTVNGNPAANPVSLNVGLNKILTVVTAPNGTTKQTYTTNITRTAASTNALYTSIALSPVSALTGISGPAYLNFNSTVPYSETSVQVVVTAKDPTATITVNGLTVTSGVASQPIALNVGVNAITAVITAQDGVTSKMALINVNRALPNDATLSNLTTSTTTVSPSFASATVTYTGAQVPYTTSSLNLTPATNDANATVTVNGVPATSGLPSTVNLNVGLNSIKTVVTAQNGTTTKTYTLNVVRTAASTNALLALITATPTETLVGTTGPGYLNFYANVPNTISSIQFTATAKDANATITVAGTPVVSGNISQAIPLAVGANSVLVVITAQDGITQKTVSIVVNRAAPPAVVSIYSVSKPIENVSLNDDGIVVHQALSPNGDGVNEYLTIDNITSYPDNHLTIVDRNGSMVYEAKGYDNATKQFDGHAANGKMQQPGTYFYSLNYTVNGETHSKTGYIILKY